MTTSDPLALWGMLSPTQRAMMAEARRGHPAGNLNRTWRSLEALKLAERSPMLRKWFLTDLGLQVSEPPAVFLDMDGVVSVVIDRPRFQNESEKSWKGRQASAHERLDVAAVLRLNRVVAATGARFVSSSTWREKQKPADAAKFITKVMREVGFVGEVVDATPQLGPGRRGEEVQAWLDAQQVKPRAFAILDDWQPMGHLTPRTVYTNYDVRLTEADVDRVIALLTPPMPLATRRTPAAPSGAGATT